ncbi:hypothetical protein F4X33_04925 [Candidatus Poribacteria bacterium]|nr:hypothetical protein [Candidatus Poribacteria bacterium]
MSIEDFEKEIDSLNQRRGEDECWRKALDNHRDMIECFIVSNSGLIKYSNRIIELAERDGLTERHKVRFTDLSENCEAWVSGIELISSCALLYSNRINQMIGSNLIDMAEEMEALKQRVYSMRTVADEMPVMEGFIDASINLVIGLYQIMEIVEAEYRDLGLTPRVNCRLGDMANDVAHVDRVLKLIPEILPAFLVRVERINNQ